MTPQLTRRQLLAAVGGAGVGTGIAAAGLARADAWSPPYTQYTYAAPGDTDDRRLRVAWYETYNGAFLESTNASGESNETAVFDPATEPTYVNDPGPVIGISDALPGDSGVLVVGLEADEVDTDNERVDVWLRVTLSGNTENGVNEPESLAAGEDDPLGPSSGDDDPNRPAGTGELAETLGIRVWKDGGFGGMGACNGQKAPTETGLVDASLLTVATTDDLADGELVVEGLAQGNARCVSFAWDIPAEIGNHIQGDGVSFVLEFVGQSPDAGNPFTTTTTTEGAQ
jgi:hypothetical protein